MTQYDTTKTDSPPTYFWVGGMVGVMFTMLFITIPIEGCMNDRLRDPVDPAKLRCMADKIDGCHALGVECTEQARVVCRDK